MSDKTSSDGLGRPEDAVVDPRPTIDPSADGDALEGFTGDVLVPSDPYRDDDAMGDLMADDMELDT